MGISTYNYSLLLDIQYDAKVLQYYSIAVLYNYKDLECILWYIVV